MAKIMAREKSQELFGRGARVPHGLRVGSSRVRVGVDFLLPVHNPYPVCGYYGYRKLQHALSGLGTYSFVLVMLLLPCALMQGTFLCEFKAHF